jgi:hypothetical protein
MASTVSTVSVASNAARNSANIMNTISSAVKGGLGGLGAMFWIASVIFIGLVIASFVKMSQFAGDVDNWNELKPKITQVITMSVFAIIAGGFAIFTYIVQDPAKSIYFALGMSLVALVLAYTAIGVACITR